MSSLPVGQDPYQQPLQVPLQAPYEDIHHGIYAPPPPGHGPNEHHRVNSIGASGDESVLRRSLTADLMHGEAHGLRDPGLSSPRWHTPFCGFFTPLSLCCTTCCIPGITFGKAHHRLRWGNDMEKYETCNGLCWLYCGANWTGLHWIPLMMQRGDVRNKYNIDGSGSGDCCSACFCPLCSLVQHEKEVKFRQSLPGALSQVAAEQYQSPHAMELPRPQQEK